MLVRRCRKGRRKAHKGPPLKVTVPSWRRLGALDVEDLAQGVLDLDELGGIGHHAVDVLVGVRNLIDELGAGTIDDAFHACGKVRLGEAGLGLGTRHDATRAVRRRLEARRVALALHDVASGAHRAGDEAAVAFVRIDGALACEPHVLTVVVLTLGVVVVAVDALELEGLAIRARPGGDAVEEAVHHLIAVEQRKVLCPVEIRNVGVELGRTLDEVGQVLVRELDPVLLAVALRGLDVILCNLVTHAARARMQEQPDAVIFVETQLDEVVAAAQAAQLLTPIFGVTEIHAGVLSQLRELARAGLGTRVHDPAVVVSGRERNGIFDRGAQVLESEVLDIRVREVGPHGDHAAADVHADSRRDDGAQRAEDGADRRAFAKVGIRHERHVWVDEGQVSDELCLRHRLVFNNGGEVVQAHKRAFLCVCVTQFVRKGLLGRLTCELCARVARLAPTSGISRAAFPGNGQVSLLEELLKEAS
ncbi:hypothetical protein FRC0038_01876 [Corynebacterium diphtheriae]|nr:hypothetical protein FRC0038_01876 [Corynebacterium diphtheriae]